METEFFDPTDESEEAVREPKQQTTNEGRYKMETGFLDLTDESMEDAHEPQAVEEGEYTLRITDWRTSKTGDVIMLDKNDEPYMMPILEVIECEEADFAKPIVHFLKILNEDMSKKDRNSAKWNLKAFCECFGIDYTQRIDFESCVGLTGDVLLYVAEDTGYGEQNKIRKFMTPR